MDAELGDLTTLTGKDAGKVRYILTVEPASDTSDVTVTLGTAIQDAAGNQLDEADSTLTATYDKTPPTVEITEPTAPDTDGNLTFTFKFSEPVQVNTIVIDRAGSDNVRLGEKF